MLLTLLYKKIANVLSQIKKIRIYFISSFRLIVLRLYNPGLKVGEGFFCAGGCRISQDRVVVIGDNFYMGSNCHLGANMRVGSDVMFASEVAVVGGDHKIDYIDVPIRYSGRDTLKTAEFGDGCWIGHGSIILHGVKIGKGAVVAAGSVVTKDVMPESVVAGNPAKLIRYRKH